MRIFYPISWHTIAAKIVLVMSIVIQAISLLSQSSLHLRMLFYKHGREMRGYLLLRPATAHSIRRVWSV